MQVIPSSLAERVTSWHDCHSLRATTRLGATTSQSPADNSATPSPAAALGESDAGQAWLELYRQVCPPPIEAEV